jgi:FkbM family methyltransferase
MQSTKLAPFTIHFENSQEYHGLKNEIFTQGVYYFETDRTEPKIIDAGAHIGLSTLYFKKLFPHSEVIAIEPNPQILPLLEKNIWENDIRGVEVVAAALAAQTENLEFYFDATEDQWLSTAGIHDGAWTKTQTSQVITIPAVPLVNFLEHPIDFLKMDIEGNEESVLTATGAYIEQIQHMIIEFHPVPQQSLSRLCDFLIAHRFKVKIWKDQYEISVKKAHGLVYIEAWQK